MFRSPFRFFHGTLVLTASILVILLVCSHAPTAQAISNHQMKRSISKPVNLSKPLPCMRKLTPIWLHQPGCEPRRTMIPYCTGAGHSFDRNSPNNVSLRERRCSCCASTRNKATRRNLNFVCGGRNETRSVFFQKISTCGFVDCDYLLNKL